MRDREIDRRITKGFVAFSPEWVVLTPMDRTRTLAGGFTVTSGSNREPQLFTVIESSNKGDGAPASQQLVDGVERRVTYVLVGDPSCVVDIGDVFSRSGARHEIAHIMPSNGYEIRAVAVAHV